MSNNRPAQKPNEQAASAQFDAQSAPPIKTQSIKTNTNPEASNALLVAREAGKIVVIGTGVAAGLYPLDLVLQYLHTNNKASATAKPSPGPNFTRASLSGLSFGAARALLKGYASSASNSVIKNATLQQSGKLLNGGKVVGEERPDMRSEDFEERNAGSNPSLTRLAAVTGVIGLADTTFSQYFANQRTWNIHQFYLQQKNINYTVPKPSDVNDFFKIYSAGYPLRLSRNIVLTGGLLATCVLDEQLKNFNSLLSPSERALAAATMSGSIAGFGSNIIEVIYKNQVIDISKDFRTPSALSTAKKLIAENGHKALIRGYGTSMLYTVAAYNLVPYMVDFAQTLIPKVELAVRRTHGVLSCSVASFFSIRGKAAEQAKSEKKTTPSRDPEEASTPSTPRKPG